MPDRKAYFAEYDRTRRTPKTPEQKAEKARKKREKYKADREAGMENGAPKDYGKLNFVSIDGEAFVSEDYPESYYGLLYSTQVGRSLYRPRPLRTMEIFDYVTAYGARSNRSILTGYGLGYDFDNWLRDLPDRDYHRLEELDPAEDEWVRFGPWQLKYIRNRILRLRRASNPKRDWWVQDTIGYFQSSFVEALKKWNLDKDFPEDFARVMEGKAERGTFTPDMLPRIQAYNETECRLHVEMMKRFARSMKTAFDHVGLRLSSSSRSWYGPGCVAGQYLEQTHFVEQHPAFMPTGDAADFISVNFPGIYADHPFIAAYTAGHIEGAAAGHFPKRVDDPYLDYDVNSAYPYAISLLPKWDSDTTPNFTTNEKATKKTLKKRPMGMYHVEWNFPADWYWYPFWYRRRPNVFYPAKGRGWIMSPEVYAAMDTIPYFTRYVTVDMSLTLPGTDGYGDGETRLPPDRLCDTAPLIERMTDERLIAKAEGRPEERSYKLAYNSGYGKEIQQVGSHKFFESFCASWTTSVCRAKVLRAIMPERENPTVIAVKTDGILSTVRLPYAEERISKNLGDFEKKEVEMVNQLLPGVYSTFYDGEWHDQVRGFGRGFDFDKALRVLYGEDSSYPYTLHLYVNRTLASHIHELHNDDGTTVKLTPHTWVDLHRNFRVSLRSKREPISLSPGKEFQIPRSQAHRFFSPRVNPSPESPSEFFRLNFRSSEFAREETPDPEYGELTVEERVERSVDDGQEEAGMVVYPS